MLSGTMASGLQGMARFLGAVLPVLQVARAAAAASSTPIP